MKVISIILLLMNYGGEVPPSQIQKEMEVLYKAKVIIKVDDLPYTTYSEEQQKYRADKLIAYLVASYPKSKVIAITSQDLCTYETPLECKSVIALGSLSNIVSITSTYRLKKKNLNDRVIKTILHQVGHMYGLEHCEKNYPCLMKANMHSTYYLDRGPKTLCEHCKFLLN